jgi:lactate dehydrogenase-like 2-hydroxyacid dehydrogenase
MKIVVVDPTNLFFDQMIKESKLDITFFDTSPSDKQELIARIAGAEIVKSHGLYIDQEVIDSCPTLKYIVIPAVGVDHYVDAKYAASKGIVVCNCPGYNKNAVAELALGLSLSVLRNIPVYDKQLKSGLWSNSNNHNEELKGKNVGLVGHGNVGKSIEQLYQAFGAVVDYTDSSSSDNQIDELFANSDIIVICCPLTEQTRGLASSARLHSMKSSSYIVNVGRGDVVDQAALYQVLASNKIAGAGLDVYIDEPMGESTTINNDIAKLTSLPNVVATPHIAGTSNQSRQILANALYQNIVDFNNYSPVNTVSV